MTRRTATSRAFLILILAAGCAGPEPSGSPEASFAFDPLPSALPTAATPTIEPTPGVTPAEPTPEPTIEPEATPDGASAPRTEIEINRNVVERPGVPGSLRDKYWWTVSDVGLLGTTAQLGLPRGEWVMNAADGLVISEQRRGDPDRTELLVRRFETGTVVGQVQTTLVNVRALVVDRHLFWTGSRPENVDCAIYNVDGGVWAMDLDDDRGPIAIVDPGRVTSCGFGGRSLRVSPSGDTIAALMTNDPYWVDVIDTASLSRRDRLVGFWPTAIMDHTFIQEDDPPSDAQAPGNPISAYDLGTGDRRWSYPAPDEVQYFGRLWAWGLGSQFLVEYVDGPRDEIDVFLATFDPYTGRRHVLLKQRDTREEFDVAFVEFEMSSGSYLTLSFDDRSGWYGAAPREFSLVEVATGDVTWNAFTIDPPWLCYGGKCFRDE